MGHMRTISFLFIFQIIVVLPIYSLDLKADSTRIYLKSDGREINTVIKEVTFYGLIMEDAQTVSYSVISKINTDQEWILDSIQCYVDSTEKSEELNGSYTLDMRNATFEIPVNTEEKTLKNEMVLFNILTNRAENFELGFSFTPRFIDGVYFQISYTNGRYVSGYSYSLSAVSFGISKQFKVNSGELYAGIFYGGKSLYVSYSKFLSPSIVSVRSTVPYLELMYRNDLFTYENFVYSIGTKIYFSNIEFLSTHTTFGFSLGIGYKLNDF